MVLQIGRYQTERELGRGGMGIVYAARDPEGRAVAVKLLKPGTASRERRFQREVEALVRLRHEGLVRLLDAGDHHGWPFLVTELVEGESLEERLARDGPLEPPLAAALLRDVARGLAHAHAQGVLHRDVKPSNVLIDRDGRGRLIDFGLTRDAAGPGSLTHSGQLLGTPGFWSPEQARGDRAAVGPATDVYGAGATLYAALSVSRRPRATRRHELLVATTERAPTPPRAQPGVDRARGAVPARPGEGPAARFPSADACCTPLDAWLARGQGGGGRGRTAALLAGAAGRWRSLAPPPRGPAQGGGRRSPTRLRRSRLRRAGALRPSRSPRLSPRADRARGGAGDGRSRAPGRARLVGGAGRPSRRRAARGRPRTRRPSWSGAGGDRARGCRFALDDADAAVDLAPDDADACMRGDARARRGDDEATESERSPTSAAPWASTRAHPGRRSRRG
ncbi:MAG: serine/threonine protein kinase [Planctomycetota bacterium]|nr:serine/threonine protein kinase [Planctomycetota bacterium]